MVNIQQRGGQDIGIAADVADPSSLRTAFQIIGKQLPGSKLAADVYNVNGGFIRK